MPVDLLQLVNEGVLRKFTKDGHVHFDCNLCRKLMSGVVPTQAHVNSVKHLNKYSWVPLCSFPLHLKDPNTLHRKMYTPLNCLQTFFFKGTLFLRIQTIQLFLQELQHPQYHLGYPKQLFWTAWECRVWWCNWHHNATQQGYFWCVFDDFYPSQKIYRKFY